MSLEHLASAVILCAVRDLVRSSSSLPTTRDERETARQFLFSRADEHAEARDLWATHAGLDGDLVRTNAGAAVERYRRLRQPMPWQAEGVAP